MIVGGGHYLAWRKNYKRGVWSSAICDKAMKIEVKEAKSSSTRLSVIIFSRSVGGDEPQKSGGQEIFIRCGGSCTTVASI